MDQKIKNEVFLLPSDVQYDINTWIIEGHKPAKIDELLHNKWESKIGTFPSKSQLYKYIAWFKNSEEGKKIKQEFEVSITDEESLEMLKKLKNDTISIGDKKKILQLLIHKSMLRIKKIEAIQDQSLVPAMENCLIKHQSEIREFIELLAELDKEMAPEKEVIVNIIDTRLLPIIHAFYRVVQTVVPEKLETIKVRLKEELQKIFSSDRNSIIEQKLLENDNVKKD